MRGIDDPSLTWWTPGIVAASHRSIIDDGTIAEFSGTVGHSNNVEATKSNLGVQRKVRRPLLARHRHQ
jgi:hypothetical protein